MNLEWTLPARRELGYFIYTIGEKIRPLKDAEGKLFSSLITILELLT